MANEIAMKDLEKRPIEGYAGQGPSKSEGGIEDVRLDPAGLILRPTPSSSRLDPLNWPKWKKHLCLANVALFYFLFTFLTTVTVPSFADLQVKLNATYSQLNYTVAVPALGLAVGHLFWTPYAFIIGRRPVLIVSCVVALVASIGSGVATSYSGYMAARFFQGFAVSPAATIGLIVIDDLYFEHERGQKVGIWTLAIDIGLVFGPLPGGFVDLVSVDWPAWLTAILFGASLIGMLVALPETAFNRDAVMHGGQDPVAHRFIRFGKLPEAKRTSPLSSLIQFFKMFLYFDVAIAVIFYCWTWYWWALTVITMIPAAYPQYSASVQGLLFIGLLVGTIFAEIFLSGTLSDWLVARLAKKNGNMRIPEHRLWLTYPAALLTFIGITIFGWSVEYSYHWIVGQIGLAIFAAGIQQGNTMICSYFLDAYPELTMNSVVFYTVNLNLAAFVSPFFIVPWVDKDGFGWSFTAQGLIALVATCLVIPFLQVFGARLRSRNH